jgi:hypothetical protein
MGLVDHTSIRRQMLTAIAAGIFTSLAVSSAGVAWGQDAGLGWGGHRSSRDADDGHDGRRR